MNAIPQVRPSRRLVVTLVGLGAALLWAYWPTLAEVVRRWSVDPTYSHGYFVPALAALILWARRDRLDAARLKPCWWGLALVALGTAMRLASAYHAVYSPDRFSIVVVLAGLCVGLGGWHALRWAWPGVAFLLFMLPLPAGFDRLLSGPLQRVATVASANALQTLGFVAEPEGNVLLLGRGELGVVEACSGLRMFITFCALTTALAVLGRRSLAQRLVIVASAFPLAVVCNVARITATGVVHETLGPDSAQVVFHDLAGWLMIALAVALLAVELKVLSHLFVPAGADASPPLLGPARSRGPQRTQRPAGADAALSAS